MGVRACSAQRGEREDAERMRERCWREEGDPGGRELPRSTSLQQTLTRRAHPRREGRRDHQQGALVVAVHQDRWCSRHHRSLGRRHLERALRGCRWKRPGLGAARSETRRRAQASAGGIGALRRGARALRGGVVGIGGVVGLGGAMRAGIGGGDPLAISHFLRRTGRRRPLSLSLRAPPAITIAAPLPRHPPLPCFVCGQSLAPTPADPPSLCEY